MKIKREIDLSDLLSTAAQNEMSPSTYQYYKGLENGRIIFNDNVCETIVESVIIPLIDMDADPNINHIEIYINSYGGDVYTGMALCHVIEHLKTPTTVHLLAIAASMSAIIAMSGHNNPNVTTICSPYTVFLIHQGSLHIEGSSSQAKDTFAFQEEYDKLIDDYILSHSDIPPELYEKKTRYEWWFSAKTALELGIISKIA